MSRLIIDVTYLAHWQGKLTGIPRVIHEIALRYVQTDTECIFVVWDNQSASLLEVDMNLTIRNRGTSLHYLSGDNINNSGLARHITYRALYKLKQRTKMPIPSAIISKLSVSARLVHKIVTPAKGDILVILMGEWHNQAYINTIKRSKAEGARLVQVCYDVLPLVQPQYSGHSTDTLNQYNRQVMPLCSLVLAISEHTKNDLADWLLDNDLSVPPIGVFRLGDDFEAATGEKPGDELFKKSGLKGGDYILTVGTIEARKNHTLLYYVYKLALQRKVELPKLVVVGRRGWKTDDFFEIANSDPDTNERIVFLTSCSDEELSWLYDHSLFSVYPSFYEGWGLPIAESIVRGVPCLSSNTSSMPEIAGALIEYFNPASTDECLAGMQRLLETKGRQAAKKSISKYRPYTWDESFKQVDKLIKELYEKSN